MAAMNVHPEVLFASGYALFLLAVARGLVALAQRARSGEAAWPRSTRARFHQGLSTVLVLLAGLLVGACAVRHPEGLELALLGVVSLAIAWVARRAWVEWWEESSASGEG
jgi:cytochrome b561